MTAKTTGPQTILDTQIQEAHRKSFVAHSMNPDSNLLSATAYAQYQFLDKVRDLAADMRSLASKLNREAARLEEGQQGDCTRSFSVNSLGEVQGQGGEIDRRCAEQAILLNQFNTLLHLAAKATPGKDLAALMGFFLPSRPAAESADMDTDAAHR